MDSEDEVRKKASETIGLSIKNKKGINGFKQGTGQITTFETLGIGNDPHEPDGWYLPNNHQNVAIILEFKKPSIDILNSLHANNEIKRNCNIVLKHGYNKVVGILYNGKDIRVYKNNKKISTLPKLQSKYFYFDLFTNKKLNKQKIYKLTKKINDNLHINFGIKNLYHRMIFTACALVAERYDAKLENLKDMDFGTIRERITKVLKKQLSRAINRNEKLNTLIHIYNKIDMNNPNNQDAIRKFITNVVAISKQINSHSWNGEDVMGIFFNEFNRYKPKSEEGQIFTPEHITDFMYQLLNCNSNDCILDATCGSGGFLVKAMSNMIKSVGDGEDKASKNKRSHIKSHQLFGVELDKEIYALACANMLIHKDGKTNLIQDDSRYSNVSNWIKSKPITKVLMNPPYENKYGCLKIVDNVLNSVQRGTKCAFILPTNKLERGTKRYIRHIVNHNNIKMIIKMPTDLFFGVGIETSIFVIIAGEKQDDEIFGCYMKNDGFETVKNEGRHDTHNKWSRIEDYWLTVIKHRNDDKYHTAQWINPKKHLSYQMPKKPFKVTSKDFENVALEYELYKKHINIKKMNKKIINYVLFGKARK